MMLNICDIKAGIHGRALERKIAVKENKNSVNIHKRGEDNGKRAGNS